LPSILYSFFNVVFVLADIYHHTMLPLQNMFKPPAGATAEESMLLDYLSPDSASTLF
jgi:hypothetical protein